MRVIAVAVLVSLFAGVLLQGCSFIEGGPVPCLDVRLQVCPVKNEPLSRQSSTR